MKLLEGEIAAVDGRLMTGWIAAPEGMAAPVLVEFAAGDQLLGSTLAQLDKSPAPPRLVFEFLLPGCLVDGRARDIAARIGGAPVALRNARHRLGAPVLAPAGYVDQITKAAKVEGWAWYPDQPETRVELEFLADGVVIGSAIADLSRPDLAKAGIGDGCHSFSWPLPFDVLVSPGEAVISVRDKATGTTLRRPLVFEPQNAADALVAFAAQQMDVRPDEAEAALGEALRLAPENIQVLLGLARCARKRGDRAAALGHFETAARLAPEDVWRWLDVAEDLRELGRLDEAEAALREALRLAPENIHVHIGCARCARKRGDRVAALGHFETAARLAPEDVWRWLDVAEDLRELGRLDEAEAALREALRLAPENIHVHIGFARCARKRGDRAAALGHFEEAARLAPEDVWRWLNVAEDLRELGRLDEAEAALREAQLLAPENVHVHMNFARCARKRGDRTAALGHFETAARLVPEDIYPRLEIAQEQRDAGDTDAARQTAEAILQSHPNEFQVIWSLAHTERLAG
ncbi:MAG: tetratricopeptide repeat protein, partial [Acidocella sp.]